MKNVFFSLLLGLMVMGCNTASRIDKIINSVELPAYAGPNSFQVSLLDKISVTFAPSFYQDNVQQVNRNQLIPLLIYFQWNRDFINFLYLDKDRETLEDNFRQSILTTFSKSKIHPKIDSLHFEIEAAEVIVPYRNKGYYMPITIFFRVQQEESIGPSRVSLQLAYRCYHSNGKVIANTNTFQTTIGADYLLNDRTSGTVNAGRHVESVYTIFNELLRDAATEILQVLESER